ncbi:MAG: LysR family transcriptional regulator [Lachnospiraceae bacterium]|nr:LysR family transcriptional regulator [Lachnospiraceae bacterium]
MTSKELLYVKTVADERNISRAAKKLYIAQPSLSQSIQRIEESVGTPLFNRTNTGLSLTFAGERYYHMASQILKIYEDFELEISDINDMKTGRIHMGTTNHLGTIVLPQVMKKFRQICTYVELHVSEENTAVLEQLLLSGELDFCIMHAPKKNAHPQIQYDIMNKDPFVIALSPDHELIRRAVPKEGYPYPVLDIRLLKNERFLMLHEGQRIRHITDSVLEKAGITQPDITLQLRNYETAQMLAAEGLGVTLVPLHYSRITSGECQPALLCIDEKYDASWSMCVAYLKTSFLSKADQLFIQLTKDMFSE